MFPTLGGVRTLFFAPARASLVQCSAQLSTAVRLVGGALHPSSKFVFVDFLNWTTHEGRSGRVAVRGIPEAPSTHKSAALVPSAVVSWL